MSLQLCNDIGEEDKLIAYSGEFEGTLIKNNFVDLIFPFRNSLIM